MAIDVCQRAVVAGSAFGESRRGGRVVFTAVTGDPFELASLGRLQQGETKFPIGGQGLLSFGGQRRNPAIRRIDNQRNLANDTLVTSIK